MPGGEPLRLERVCKSTEACERLMRFGQIKAGEFVASHGPSGSLKTTNRGIRNADHLRSFG